MNGVRCYAGSPRLPLDLATRRTLPCLPLAILLVLLTVLGAAGQETASVPLADGFICPVGCDSTKRYYKARGVRANGHLGEDWNGAGGGDTDLGDPICATAHGIVVFAQDYHLGWGNVVILRHAYLEAGEMKFVDSLYGHLLEIKVRDGQLVRQGDLIGTMGNNHGMYDAHLHFEMRKNLSIGMHRSSFARDFSNYWDPTDFIAAHGALPGAGRSVAIPVGTFAATPPPAYAAAIEEGFRLAAPAPSPAKGKPTSTPAPRVPFKADRFSDLRE